MKPYYEEKGIAAKTARKIVTEYLDYYDLHRDRMDQKHVNQIAGLVEQAISAALEDTAKIADQFTLDAPVKLITLIAQHNTASTIAEMIRALIPK